MNSLHGRRILVSRAREQASELSSKLRALGAEVLEIPFIEIRRPRSFQKLDNALRRIQPYDWLILTSVNGVNALFTRLEQLAIAPQQLRQLQIAAIGPATRAAIEQHGLKVTVVPQEYVAESVVRSLRAKVRGKRVLLVRAKVARDVIPRQLRDPGADVDVVGAYETVGPKRSAAELKRILADPARAPQVITFTSSSTARNFLTLLGARLDRSVLDGIKIASIGPVTSATLRDLGLRVDIEAREYTMQGLVEAIAAS